MPSRNAVKEYVPQSYYHVYNLGVNKRKLFLDDQDYTVFLSLLKRYLSKETQTDNYGRLHTTHYDDIELLAYCLMPNHYHLLIYVNDDSKSMAELMRRVGTSYTMYFNKKYKRVGSLFQGRYKASRISDEPYLVHISRYIHRNPKGYKQWPYSTVQHYIGDMSAEWVRPQKIYELYEYGTYEAFLDDWEDVKANEDDLKYLLAHTKPKY